MNLASKRGFSHRHKLVHAEPTSKQIRSRETKPFARNPTPSWHPLARDPTNALFHAHRFDVQEIRRRIGNQQQAHIDVSLWYGHAITGIGNCAPVEPKLVLVEIRLERTQCHSSKTISVLLHLRGRGPLGFVDTACNADKDLHVAGLWC